MMKQPQDKLETIEVKYQGKVLCKLTSQQVVDAAADDVDGCEKEYDGMPNEEAIILAELTPALKHGIYEPSCLRGREEYPIAVIS
jgi:hypothetical protein